MRHLMNQFTLYLKLCFKYFALYITEYHIILIKNAIPIRTPGITSRIIPWLAPTPHGRRNADSAVTNPLRWHLMIRIETTPGLWWYYWFSGCGKAHNERAPSGRLQKMASSQGSLKLMFIVDYNELTDTNPFLWFSFSETLTCTECLLN